MWECFLLEKDTYKTIGGLWLRIGYFGYVSFLTFYAVDLTCGSKIVLVFIKKANN